jgi:hypothetical protein
MRVWSSGIHHVAVGPLDVACSKDLTNTPIMVYFGVFWGVFPVDLGASDVVVRAVVLVLSAVASRVGQYCERRPNPGAEPRATSSGPCARLSLRDRRAALADL